MQLPVVFVVKWGQMGVGGFMVILGLLLISGIADNLPVFSCVLIDKSLIINTIHFSGLQAFSGVL